MRDLSYNINENGNFQIQIDEDKSQFVYIMNTIEDVYEVLEKIDMLNIDQKNQSKITKAIKEIKNMFQVQCLSTYGGPGLGKSTTALNVTADLKKAGVDADYTSEVAKDKVYGKNLNELKDQSSIIGEQIKRLNTLVKSRDISIAVQDSPFILGIAYQNKEDPHVDEEDFKTFYVKQYLNYINLNILLQRKEDVIFQEVGRVQNLEQSIHLDGIIRTEVLEDNGLCYIELPAYEASKYMVELGQTMNGLTVQERYDIFVSTEDKRERSINYHIFVLEKTIEILSVSRTDIEVIADNLDIPEDLVIKVLREYKNINKNEYITAEEMISTLSKSLTKLKLKKGD